MKGYLVDAVTSLLLICKWYVKRGMILGRAVRAGMGLEVSCTVIVSWVPKLAARCAIPQSASGISKYQRRGYFRGPRRRRNCDSDLARFVRSQSIQCAVEFSPNADVSRHGYHIDRQITAVSHPDYQLRESFSKAFEYNIVHPTRYEACLSALFSFPLPLG